MGAAMARNLVSAGMEVRAWNRTREKAEPLADDGAKVADTPAEAAAGAGFVLTMLSDGDAVAEAVDGEDGALLALPDDGVWLQMSTVGIEGHERLAQIAGERGVFYVDAPVLGTKEPAEQGQLIVLASGPEEVQAQCQPVFDAVGSNTLWLGSAGTGSRLKLVTNNWIVGILGVLAETVSPADKRGCRHPLRRNHRRRTRRRGRGRRLPGDQTRPAPVEHQTVRDNEAARPLFVSIFGAKSMVILLGDENPPLVGCAAGIGVRKCARSCRLVRKVD